MSQSILFPFNNYLPYNRMINNVIVSQVFHNPTYRSKVSSKDKDGNDCVKESSMNHYETTEPTPVYESIDEDLYEKVRDAATEEHETEKHATTETGTEPARQSQKKSRTNPVYDFGDDDDSLNPVVNLSVTSPKKSKSNWESFGPVDEENDFDDKTKILSTFQATDKRGKHYENVGVVNPLASHKDDTQEEGRSEDDTGADPGISPPMSPPPVYNNNELYFMGQPAAESNEGAQSSC